MTIKNRILVDIISARLAEKSPLIQVIVGPRQIGKTTALKAVLDPHALYETADGPVPVTAIQLENWWQEAVSKKCKVLAIDEIQKVSDWTEVLKKLWDAHPYALKVIVTGSSALLVEKGLKETLSGRYELIRAEHWNLAEAKQVFRLSLNEFIEYGCYPGSIPLYQKDTTRWAQYIKDSIIEPALGRDLLQLHPVDQPALLRQLFGVAVSLPCQIVSLQKMQGQLQGRGTLPTLQNYLKLLSDAYLVSGVQKYSPSLFRAKKSSPKLIVHDNALIRVFERPLLPKISAEKLGHYFENCVGARFIESGWETYYWKDRHDEVDFIVLGPKGEKWAIEVKTKSTKPEDLKSLLQFCKIHQDFEPCLISLIDQKIPDVKTLDVQKILSLTREY